jgi:branched-chain amino acid transport system permease protein
MSRSAPRSSDTSLLAGQKKWAAGFAIAATLIFILYTVIVPGLDDQTQTFMRTWIPATSINEAVIWALCALGLNITVGYGGVLDLGFVAFVAIGGYAAGWLMSAFFQQVNVRVFTAAPEGQRGIHLSFWAVLVIGGMICAFFAMAIGAPTLRLRNEYVALVTLGFGALIPQVFGNGWNLLGVNFTNGSRGMTPIDPISLAGKTLRPFDLSWKYLIYCFLVALVLFISLRLREGRLGRAWRAIREDETAASSLGVSLLRIRVTAYAIGAFVGGLGGVAFATHDNAVRPDRFNLSTSIILLAMVVIGGMGNVWGVMLIALIISWVNSTGVPQIGDALNSAWGTTIDFPAITLLFFGGLLVLMMVFRREGLFPERKWSG